MAEALIPRSGDPERSAAILGTARAWHKGTPVPFSPAAAARAAAGLKITMEFTAVFDRIRLVGDEGCGVGIHCRDCEDGGRPLGYLGDPYADDAVIFVKTVPDLLAVGRRHREERHS
jgi:hypothetical protein